jgi:hypothetical protein
MLKGMIESCYFEGWCPNDYRSVGIIQKALQIIAGLSEGFFDLLSFGDIPDDTYNKLVAFLVCI